MADVRVLIVDDEPLVRRGLRRILDTAPDVTVVGEARHGLEALEQVEALAPDLILLDVQMPELDGIEVARQLRESGSLPGVIFVTAYDRYAVEAFEHHAIDYLLKPFDRERVLTALDRARARLRTTPAATLSDHIAELLEKLDGAPTYRERFAVRSGNRIVMLDAGDIAWIEAADNYVRLHAGRRVLLMRETMKNLEQRLDPARFARVHRSTIVNLAHVAEVLILPSGDATIRMRSGASLSLSRRFRAAFEKRVGGLS